MDEHERAEPAARLISEFRAWWMAPAAVRALRQRWRSLPIFSQSKLKANRTDQSNLKRIMDRRARAAMLNKSVRGSLGSRDLKQPMLVGIVNGKHPIIGRGRVRCLRSP